jgi:outer membrane usher protein FimD/PapC
VYYDVNGDGVFDAGDLPAANVRVVVNGAQVRSDSSGRYHAWNVVSYEAPAIAIDTLAFTDFSWTLLRGRTTVRATPGTFNRVDFPLVRTRGLAGQLVADSSIATVGGVTLLLASAGGGPPQRIVTFSDGSFYVSRVLPGRYLLSVASSALDALQAVAEPSALPVEIALVANDPVLTVPSVRLRRRPAPAP